MSDDFRKLRTEEDLKDKILSSVSQAFTGEETNRWMVALQEESAGKAEEPVVTGSSDNKLNENMASVVDRLFDNFKRYAFEFNRSLEHREHVVNCERPSSMRSQADYSDMGGQSIRFCIGHISSRDWALVVQAEENRVRAFITPIKFLVGFRPDQSDFEPYVELLLVKDRVGNSRQMIWTIDGQALALESIPALSRRFFGQLVKVTRGEASSTDHFVFDPNDLSALQTEVVVERSYEPDDQAMFFSEKPRPSELMRKAVADRPGHTLAQLANVGQSHGILPQSGPNASIHAARSAGADLLGQTQAEPDNSASHATNHSASPVVNVSNNSANQFAGPVVSVSNNSARQFASPAAAPRQLSISSVPPPAPTPTSPTPASPTPATPTPAPTPTNPPPTNPPPTRQYVAEEPMSTPAPREELSFFSKAVQEPKEEAISPASGETIPKAVEPKVEVAAKEPVAKEKEAKEPAVREPAVKEPEPIPVPAKAELKTELKTEVRAKPEAEPEPKPADKVSATAAAIASQATTQTLSNAGVNGEKSTYHFVARPEEEESQKVDLNTDKDIAENNRRVAHAIKNLFDSVDTSISSLTAVGVDAMKADDIAAVSSIMRQTKTLKVLRDGIVQLSKDWQKSLEN